MYAQTTFKKYIIKYPIDSYYTLICFKKNKIYFYFIYWKIWQKCDVILELKQTCLYMGYESIYTQRPNN